jgi:hypothetical protein
MYLDVWVYKHPIGGVDTCEVDEATMTWPGKVKIGK